MSLPIHIAHPGFLERVSPQTAVVGDAGSRERGMVDAPSGMPREWPRRSIGVVFAGKEKRQVGRQHPPAAHVPDLGFERAAQFGKHRHPAR